MDFQWTQDQLAFAADLRAYLDSLDVSDVLAERRIGTAEVSEPGAAGQRLLKRMAADGWLGVGWPVEYGGKGRSAVEQWIFTEEMTSRRLPTGGLTLMAVGPTIMRLGTEEQKREFLPPILAGETVFAIGYSEPSAGTDLASLTTRAVLDGDDYVVNGRKIWTTGAHYATHIWLAVRTGPVAERSRAISVLLVSLSTPGISVRPLITQSDGRTNEVLFEDVRVPRRYLVGAENGGWSVIGTMLDFERSMPYASTWTDLRRLVDWCASDESGVVLDEAEVRGTLGALAADISIARLLALRMAAEIDEGRRTPAAASMTKIWYSELQQRLHTSAIDIGGPDVLLGVDEPAAPLGGVFERLYRSSPMLKFGAGTNEIQRELVATQFVGLPRTARRASGDR